MLLTLDAIAGTAEMVLTMIATSVTHTAPLLPHDFTCTVCPPVAADTEVLMEEL